MYKLISVLLIVFFSVNISKVQALTGNENIESFSKAKKILHNQVFSRKSERRTLYCGARFDSKKNITLPKGYKSSKYKKRQLKYEAEHIVPAENFGRTFVEWREGHKDCVTKKGKTYKGRRCANKANSEYRLMQADIYNLFPSVGANNAMRKNYNFAMLANEESDFGSCDMRVENKKVQPPVRARGIIARSYLYMEKAYERYKMSKSQRKLMMAWDKQYPVSPDECRRYKIIRKIQGNENPIMASRC